MSGTTRTKVLWAAWMSGGGLTTAVIVYAATGSIGWAVLGLLASGVVLNAIGQAITQPLKAATCHRQSQRLGRRDHDGHATSRS
jgi:hypothetical protein